MLAKQLKLLRESEQKSQQEVCSALNIEQSTLANYENGKRTPKLEILVKIADYYQCSLDFLLGRTTQKQGSTPTSSKESIIYKRLDELLKEDPGIDFYSSVSRIPADTLLKYAHGELEPPIFELCKLIETLGTSADYLFGRTDVPYPIEQEKNKYCKDGFPTILNKEMDGNYLETELADELGVSISYIKKILSGEELPASDILFKIAQIFQKSTDYMLGLIQQNREKDKTGNFPFKTNPTSLQRIRSILKNRLDSDTAKSLGLNEEELYMLYNYGFVPHIDVLRQLCLDYSISADYLLGLSDSKISVISQKEHDEESLLKSFRRLEKNYQKKVEGYIADQVLQLERDLHMRSSVAENEFDSTGTYGPK